MKGLIKTLLHEAIKSGHWTKDSYPSRIETSSLKDMDPKHRSEIDKRLKFIETLEFSNEYPQKIGIWVYRTPTPVVHEPFQARDKGPLLLAIINNNNMTTLFWKHTLEGMYDYDIDFNDLVEFSNSEFYDGKADPITIEGLVEWEESKRVAKHVNKPAKPTKPRTDKFKKIKLPSGKVVRYYEILNKFETIDGTPIDMDNIFDELPEQLQDMVLAKMDENENR